MYYAHFGLKQPPFKITPNTEFFFLGGNRGAILDALIYAVNSGEGIIKVVGEVGSGKTMLCRMLQVALPESVESIYLANPSLAPEEILHAIAFELQLVLPPNADRLKVMQVLQTYLLERHAAGRQVVIFVEEAQGMPLATLEEIRLLSNLETKYDKLLQIVLFGQPELDENLNETRIRQLRERITHSFYLEPFDTTEISEYLIFRLRAAGYFGPPLFTKAAVEQIAAVAKGLVRRVNILADKSLLAAFADNVYQVTPKYVQAAIKDSEFGRRHKKPLFTKRLIGLSLAVLLVGFGIEYIAMTGFKNTGLYTWAQKPSTQHVAQPQSVSEPKKQLPLLVDASPKAVRPIAPGQITPILPAAVADILPVSITPMVGSNMSVLSVVPSLQVNGQSAITVISKVAPSAAPANSVTSQVANLTVRPADDLVSLRLAATTKWLASQPASTATIQILGANSEAQLKAQLESLSKIIASNDLYVYRTIVSQLPYLTVVYGSFASHTEAAQALQRLPKDIQKYHPHLRTIAGILRETKQI